jgi:class 3 adenylate cyclase
VPELPAGTVTFLFTDIEGSTRLLQELGDDYAGVLAEHRSALRDAFARHGGVEVDTQGDAFFVAFGRRTPSPPPWRLVMHSTADPCASGRVCTPESRSSRSRATSAA